MKIYGASLAITPVTMKNRIMFVMILFLDFFVIDAPFGVVEQEKPQGWSAEGVGWIVMGV